jgi:TolB protein
MILLAVILPVLLAACSPGATQQPAGQLVFEREIDENTDIYVMNIDGTGLTRLTDSDGWDGTPSWSPDGKQIAFASERLGSPAIFLMDADGSNQRPLTSPDYASLMPVWSPDGSKIAFASTQAYEVLRQGGRQQVDAGFEIWIMDLEQNKQERITANPEDQSLYPTWAPDSDRVAFMEVADAVQIVSKKPQRNASESILSEGLEGRHWTPDWSPDGQRIAIMAEIDGVNDVWLLQTEGGEAINLTNQDSGDGEPAWSPNGGHIVFVSDRDGENGLYLINVESREVTRLTPDDATYARPDWRSAR